MIVIFSIRLLSIMSRIEASWIQGVFVLALHDKAFKKVWKLLTIRKKEKKTAYLKVN